MLTIIVIFPMEKRPQMTVFLLNIQISFFIINIGYDQKW